MTLEDYAKEFLGAEQIAYKELQWLDWVETRIREDLDSDAVSTEDRIVMLHQLSKLRVALTDSVFALNALAGQMSEMTR